MLFETLMMNIINNTSAAFCNAIVDIVNTTINDRLRKTNTKIMIYIMPSQARKGANGKGLRGLVKFSMTPSYFVILSS